MQNKRGKRKEWKKEKNERKHKSLTRNSKHGKSSPRELLQTGTLFITMRKDGIVRIPGSKEPLFVDHDDLGTGTHGDTVITSPLPKVRGRDRRARVTEIVARAKAGFAGTLKEERGVFIVTPDDPKMYADIIIPKHNIREAKSGEKVFAEIMEWQSMREAPIGKIIRILGKPGEHEAEMQGLALERGFSSDFPREVEREAEALYKEGISVGKNRRDMRDTITFTIDPEDAKDFDDALSVKILPNGLYEIGVHIADVSHYVTPGSALDSEAFRRGTSVYLVDRTIPMLPEALSNDLCSLKPNVDRLTMSAVFIVDEKAHIKESWFGKTIIHSDKRFAYEAAQKVLDDGTGEFFEELTILNTLAKILMHRRHAEGSVTFETDEVKFKLDEHNIPVDAYRKVRGDTHKLIEEWMLVANKKVAEVFKKEEKKGGLGMYRIHGLPDSEKMENVGYLARRLGYTFPHGHVTGKALNTFLKELEDKPERDMLSALLIRSMAKAIYSTKNIGHFGLAFKDYTHFTSPIRRYPDLVVHRFLQKILEGKGVSGKSQKEYERIALFASERERAAAEAERASVRYKQIEYMAARIGEEFDGIIVGITERGMFVEDEKTKSEGFVPLNSFPSDTWHWNERELTLTSQKTKKQFRLGDEVRFKVLRADPEQREVEYAIIK
jgi:ribonuclease R